MTYFVVSVLNQVQISFLQIVVTKRTNRVHHQTSQPVKAGDAGAETRTGQPQHPDSEPHSQDPHHQPRPQRPARHQHDRRDSHLPRGWIQARGSGNCQGQFQGQRLNCLITVTFFYFSFSK